MRANRRFLLRIQQIGGAYLPLAFLFLLGVGGKDFQAGALVAGGLSLVFVVASAFPLAWPQLPTLSVLLVSVSPAVGLLVFGTGGSWIEAIAAASTVLALGLAITYRRDMVAVVIVVLYWMAVWTFLLVGVFGGNWRVAAMWGGGVAVFAGLALALGRLAQRRSFRSVAAALVCACPPLGVVAWGIGADMGLAIIAGLVPTVSGAVALIFSKDYTND